MLQWSLVPLYVQAFQDSRTGDLLEGLTWKLPSYQLVGHLRIAGDTSGTGIILERNISIHVPFACVDLIV